MKEHENTRTGLQRAVDLAYAARAARRILQAAAAGGLHGAAAVAVKETAPFLVKRLLAVFVALIVLPMVIFTALPNIFFGYSSSDTDAIAQMTGQAMTIGGVYMSLDDFEADFNMESEMTQKGLVCRIRLAAEKSVDMIQEDKLLSVASSGKNENAKGIVGKIRELFRTSMQTPAITADQAGLAAIDSWYAVGISHGSPADTNVWSLMAYRSYIEQTMEPDAQERDELEKSIIARIADDVKVWLKTNSTEIVVEKLFERP